MKRLLTLCSLCFLLFNLHAATPTITVTLSEFTADHSGADYVVRLSPVTGGTARRELTDSDGVASFSAVTPAIYSLSIENAGVPTLQIRVPNTADTTAASGIVISAWTPPGSATDTITSGIWENAAGTIKPSGGQDRNTLQFTSTAADAADNLGLLLDSVDLWAAGGHQLQLRNAGTNFLTVTDTGLISTLSLNNPASDEAKGWAYISAERGGSTSTSFYGESFDDDSSLYDATTVLHTEGSGVAYLDIYSTADGYTNEYNAVLKASAYTPDLSLKLDHSGTPLVFLNPLVATGSATANTFNTSQQLTNGDYLVTFANTNAVRFSVDHAGAVAAGTTNRWATGAVVTGATVALTLTNYVSITINGVAYKLGLVQ